MEYENGGSMRRRRTDYKICPECGAALDVGEVCDCQKEYALKWPRNEQNGTQPYIYYPEKKNGVQSRVGA